MRADATTSKRRIGALFISALVIAAACGGSSATRPKSEIDFAAESWPKEAAADCPVDDAGRTVLNMRRIVSTDEHTVRFELCKPDPAFLSKLALAPVVVNDSGYLATAGVDGTIATVPNGTGPWKVDSWVNGEQIVLSRFDGYWGEKAKVKQLVITWQPEGNARLLQVQAGLADGASSIISDDYATAEGDPSLALFKRSPIAINYYFFNNKNAPFNDIRVRQAIAQGVDRARVTENFFPAGSEVARTIVPCSVQLACKGEDWYAYDPAAARALLTAAGYPNGFKTKIVVRDRVSSHTTQPKEMAVDLQAQLKEIGIDATIEVVESTTWQAGARAGELDGIMIGGGWIPDFLDPSNYLDFIFLSGSGGSPRFGAIYSDIEATLMQADSTMVAAEREKLYAEVEGLIKKNVPMVPNTYASSAALFRADVKGAYASSVQLEQLSLLTPGTRDKLVWLIEGEPNTLYCADNPSSQDAYASCFQFAEGLYRVDPTTSLATPSLAESCAPSKDGLTWTCTIRSGVKFHNGASLDATDVVDSFAVMWDCAHPWRAGSTGTFLNWSFISGYLHPEACSAGN